MAPAVTVVAACGCAVMVITGSGSFLQAWKAMRAATVAISATFATLANGENTFFIEIRELKFILLLIGLI